MVQSFDDDVAKTFFVDRPLNKENAKLYISLLGETKRVDRMFEFLQEMRKEGIEITNSVYLAAINACGPAHRYTDALQLETEMIQGAAELKFFFPPPFVSLAHFSYARTAGRTPDDRIRVALISVLAKSGQFEMALTRLKEYNVFLNPDQRNHAKVSLRSFFCTPSRLLTHI